MIFTAMPSPASSAIDAPASGFGRIDEGEEADEGAGHARPAGAGRRRPAPRAVATATTRAPSPNRRSSTPVAAAGTSMHRASTVSGAPFVTSDGRAARRPSRSPTPAGARGRTAGCRRGGRPRGRRAGRGRRAASGALPQRLVEHVSADRPRRGHGGLVADEPEPQRVGRGRARAVQGGGRSVIAPSVSVPVLSVKSTSMLPRSSIVTSRLTSTLRRASWRDPVARLTLTIAGRSCGVIPIAIASENSSASMHRPREGDVDHEDRDRQDAGHPDEQLRELVQPDLERGRGLGARAEPDRDLPERRRRARRDDDGAGRALVDDRAHERAGGEVDLGVAGGGGRRRLRRRHRLAGEHRLVALEASRLEQAHVGRDHDRRCAARRCRPARGRGRRRGARRRRAQTRASWRMLA